MQREAGVTGSHVLARMGGYLHRHSRKRCEFRREKQIICNLAPDLLSENTEGGTNVAPEPLWVGGFNGEADS